MAQRSTGGVEQPGSSLGSGRLEQAPSQLRRWEEEEGRCSNAQHRAVAGAARKRSRLPLESRL